MAIKGKKGKREPREKRKLRIRKRVIGTNERPRLCVFRSTKHMYAQVISDQSGQTLASASTLDKDLAKEIEAILSSLSKQEGKKGKEKEEAAPAAAAKSAKSVAAAMAVGTLLARRALEKNVKSVVFDRNGFIYHGRIKAVAEGARKAGLEF